MDELTGRTLPRTTLEQWRILDAVVKAGSFALAADQLSRSQSSVSYGIARLQEQVGVQLLEIQGRKAVLTQEGKALLQIAQPLIADLLQLEAKAAAFKNGWESELKIALDSIFPSRSFFSALYKFREACPSTAVIVSEVILSGADDALVGGEVHMAVSDRVPPGFVGDKLCDIEFVAIAHPDHPLNRLGRFLTFDDLTRHTHLIVKDSGRVEQRSSGWDGAREKWKVSSLFSSLEAIRNQIGFSWLPLHMVAQDLEAGRLKALPLLAGARRTSALYLIHADAEIVGKAAAKLAECLKESVASPGR